MPICLNKFEWMTNTQEEKGKDTSKQGIGKKERRPLDDRNEGTEVWTLMFIKRSATRTKHQRGSCCTAAKQYQDKAHYCTKLTRMSLNYIPKIHHDCVINTTKLSWNYYEQPEAPWMFHRNNQNVFKLWRTMVQSDCVNNITEVSLNYWSTAPRKCINMTEISLT